MPVVHSSVISDPSRVASALRATRVMPGLALPLDGIAALVARLLHTPIGAVSVISGDFDECVGAYGLPAPLPRHVPLHYSVCQYVVSAGQPLAVPDMGANVGLRDHPARRDVGVNSFAGVPLRDVAGQPVGALTVVDYVPRVWTSEELAVLGEVAALIGPIPSTTNEPDLGVLGDAQPGAAPPASTSAAVQADVRQGFIAALLDSMEVGVLAVDSTGRPVLFNRALRRIYDIDIDAPVTQAADLAERQASDLDQCGSIVDHTAVRRALAGEHVRGVEAAVHVPGRSPRTLLVNSEPIRAPDDRLLGAVSTVLDVTEARRLAQVRDAELRVASVLNQAHTVRQAAPAVVELVGALVQSGYAALWLVDPDQDVLVPAAHWTAPGTTMSDILPGRVTRSDAGPGRVWATGEPLYIPDLARSHDHAAGPARAFADACIERGLRSVVAMPLRNGDEILGVLTCMSASADSEAAHVAALISGIAGQIGAFLTRRRAADLAVQLNQARQDFITMVGHAVRTPLQSLTSYTELACDEPGLPPEARTLLQAVQRNAEALRRIVSDLLDLTALETSEDGIERTDVDVVTLIGEAVQAARPAADAVGTTLQARLPAHLPLLADGRRVRQLIDQLIDNAITYSPGGHVDIRASRTGNAVELRVADNGIGIPPDQRDRVFDRFFRADNVAHGGTPGAGLGLSLVRAITRAHCGSARIADHRGPGTTVIVRLPIGTDSRSIG
ncbi:MAG: ATP-binding protein [Actinomycetota bacterium]|nr:ATP-binding protein [Actinomycetota bacterium]